MSEAHSGRQIEITVHAKNLERMKKEAAIQMKDGRSFTISADEGEHLGGEGSAPSPLGYFVASVAF